MARVHAETCVRSHGGGDMSSVAEVTPPQASRHHYPTPGNYPPSAARRRHQQQTVHVARRHGAALDAAPGQRIATTTNHPPASRAASLQLELTMPRRLVSAPSAQHHACMIAAAASPACNATESLRDDEIHVWHFAYQRADGRAPLLVLLARYVGGEANAIHLANGEHGRPRFAPAPDPALDFNWSHSGDHAAVALARHVAPGIDLERLRERSNALPLAQRFFHPDEVAMLAALPAAERSTAFLELWTAKEAVLKATGRGIAFGLHRLQVTREPPRLTWLDGDDANAWQLQRLQMGDAYVAALAWRGGARRVNVRELAASA